MKCLFLFTLLSFSSLALANEKSSLLGELGQVDVDNIRPTQAPAKSELPTRKTFRLRFSCTDKFGKHKNGTAAYEQCMRRKMQAIKKQNPKAEQTEQFTIQFGGD